ncbi:MAG: hypothetical protein LUE98_04675 [Tannerellaceae bacterium]|nr:hypothetical protein [Tannerellaceae bacterium]
MIVYVKVKKYLKEFICNLRDDDGELVFGNEPVRFSKKSMEGQLINTWRREPREGVSPVPEPLPDDHACTYLQVEVEPVNGRPRDEKKIYLSQDAQCMIGKAIYERFCAYAFSYIQNHLNTQLYLAPKRKPVNSLAYLGMMDELGLTMIDTDTIRRAYDREKEKIKKQAGKKLNLFSKTLPFLRK